MSCRVVSCRVVSGYYLPLSPTSSLQSCGNQEEEEEEEVVVVPLEEQAGVLNGALAFDIVHSDDLWRHIFEFV